MSVRRWKITPPGFGKKVRVPVLVFEADDGIPRRERDPLGLDAPCITDSDKKSLPRESPRSETYDFGLFAEIDECDRRYTIIGGPFQDGVEINGKSVKRPGWLLLLSSWDSGKDWRTEVKNAAERVASRASAFPPRGGKTKTGKQGDKETR